jgi:transposase-like protein
MAKKKKKATNKRRRYTPDQKAAILRRHMADKVPVSDLCDEYGIQPSVFYTWQRQLLENLEAALQANGKGRASDTREGQLARKVKDLESKLVHKDNVIAEVTGEMVALKKELGEL